jgi:hypothetical protein
MARQRGLVLIAGAILIVVGLLAMVFGVGVTVLIVVYADPVQDDAWLEPSLALVSFGVAAVGLVGLVGGVGVWRGRTWGRVVGVLLSGLWLLPQIPRVVGHWVDVETVIESIVAGYVLIVLLFGSLNREARRGRAFVLVRRITRTLTDESPRIGSY